MKHTVGAIIEDNGKILLIKRNYKPFKDYWGLPGGHIDKGENSEKAVIREVKEETNLGFKPKLLLFTEENFKKIKWHAWVYFFFGKAKGNVKLSEEHKEYGWFTQNQIKKKRIAFNHKKIINEYRRLKQNGKKKNEC